MYRLLWNHQSEVAANTTKASVDMTSYMYKIIMV